MTLLNDLTSASLVRAPARLSSINACFVKKKKKQQKKHCKCKAITIEAEKQQVAIFFKSDFAFVTLL